MEIETRQFLKLIEAVLRLPEIETIGLRCTGTSLVASGGGEFERVFAEVELPKKVDEQWACVILANAIRDLIKTYDSATLHLSTTSTTFVIKEGGRKNSLRLQPIERMLPVVRRNEQYQVSPAALGSIIASVAFASGKTAPYTAMRFTSRNSLLVVGCTDGIQMARGTMPNDESFDFTLEASMIRKYAPYIRRSEYCFIGVDEFTVQFVLSDMVLVLPIHEVKIPDLHAYKFSSSYNMVADYDTLRTALKTVEVIASTDFGRTLVQASNSEMRLRAVTDIGEVTVAIPVVLATSFPDFYINASFLARGMSEFKDGGVHIFGSERLSSIMVSSTGYEYVLATMSRGEHDVENVPPPT